MAISFPVPLADFFETFPIKSFVPYAPHVLKTSRDAGGAIRTAKLGATLYRGTVMMGSLRRSQFDAFLARYSLASSPGASFFIYPYPRVGPRLDPMGAILGNSQPQISSLANNNRELGLRGLPPSYALSAGDLIAFTYGSNPTRYAAHTVVDDIVTAGASGTMMRVEVTPVIRPGAGVGSHVRLVRPAFKCVIEPNSLNRGNEVGPTIQGVTFDVIQTLG